MATNARPLLPLREVVAFPHAPLSLIIGRPKSLAAVEAANSSASREIFLAAQRSGENVAPDESGLYTVGTLGTVEQMLKLPDGNTKILVEGRRRARATRFLGNERYFEVEIEPLASPSEADPELQELVRTVKAEFERYATKLPLEARIDIGALEDPDRLADALAAPLSFKFEERQELLETVEVKPRLERIHKALLTELGQA